LEITKKIHWRTNVQQKPSILIIENNSPTLELYQRELSRDFQVLACDDETDAMALINSPDLVAVVLEPAISNNRGWNLFSDLLGKLRNRSVPIILCSTLDERKRGQEVGAADFLVKPVLPSILIETLHRVIRSSSKA
jgi:PleD family two-component response regulator